MSEELLWGMIAAGNIGTVATIKKDGRPQLSDVSYTAQDGVIRFSTRSALAKVHNLRRDPRISLKVTEDGDARHYAVAEGSAELSAVSWALNDSTVDELAGIYRRIAGEHPDWDEFRRQMVADGRLVVRVKIEHLYGWAGD